jgi:hypothetical protein
MSAPNIEPLATPEPEPLACPNSGARYTLVRAEADRASVSGQLVCRSCGGPLNGREGRFVLKYPRRSAKDSSQSRAGQAVSTLSPTVIFRRFKVPALRPPEAITGEPP